MSYLESIGRIKAAQAAYYAVSDVGGDVNSALAAFWAAKAAHKALFGAPRFSGGEWY